MELCMTRGALSTPPLPVSSSHRLLSNIHFRFPLQKLPGVVSGINVRRTWLRASSDEGSSSFMDKKSDRVATIEEDDVASPSVGNGVTPEKATPLFMSVNESSDASGFSSVNDALQPLQYVLSKLDMEFNAEDWPTILLYGGGAILSVWFLSAIVGAVDSIPVFPKLLEIVGLGYSVWFTTRYLLFKKSREELSSKIEELKQEVLGSGDK